MADTLAIIGSPEFDWLVDRLAARVERGLPLDSGTITITDPTQAQRRSIDDLLGRRTGRGQTLSIDLARLPLPNLESAVVQLRGPLRNLRAERETEAAAWNTLFEKWRTRAADNPPLRQWLDRLQFDGLLKRYGDLSYAETLLAQAWQVVATPHRNDPLLANLAARITGDSHALDRARPLATLCLRAIQETAGIDGTTHAATRREAWAAIGVIVDDLSAPVLCLNLSAAPDCAAAPWIDWHIARGEPFYLTWRQVRNFAPAPAMTTVHVCENPAVVSEAAHRLGAECRPLVCLNGMPGSTAKSLLHQIANADIPLAIRADFDWAGLRILDQIHRPPHTELWRMTPEDYHASPAGQPLRGEPLTPAWAADLTATMRDTGHAAYEEGLMEVLIEDLARSSIL